MEYPKTNVAKKKIARFGMKGRRKRKKATNNMCVGLKFNAHTKKINGES
jgi:hypothetical protein